MASKRLSKNDDAQMTKNRASLTVGERKASAAVRATAAQVTQNRHGTRGQVVSVNSKTSVSKHGVNQETSFASIDMARDKKGNTTKADVTVAKATTDHYGNTTAMAVTTAGTGQTFKVPTKGDKKIGGYQFTHDATAITEDEHGNRQTHLFFSVATYAKNIREEKYYAFKKAKEFYYQLNDHIVTRVIKKTLLLIFFIFQFLYPLIAFLIERKFILYNLICIAVGAIGTIQELTEIDLLYKDYKRCYRYFRKKEARMNEEDTGWCAKYFNCCQTLCKCCPSPLREALKTTLEEILLYIAVMCNIMAVINEQTWKLEGVLDYLDSLLLLYSLIMEILVPRYHTLKWLFSSINQLYTEYFKTCDKEEREFSYRMFGKCVNPLRFTPLFFIGTIGLQFVMLALITVRVYADNYLGIDNTTINGSQYLTELLVPEEGSYNVTLYTWLAMLGGILIPVWSILTYFIINQYWIWQPLHYIRNHTSGEQPKYSYIETMTYVDKWAIYVFDPVAWFAMILLFSMFIGFAIVTEGYDYENSLEAGGIPIAIRSVHFFCYALLYMIFISVNIQTFAFIFMLGACPYLCCLLPLHFLFHRPKNRLHNF